MYETVTFLLRLRVGLAWLLVVGMLPLSAHGQSVSARGSAGAMEIGRLENAFKSCWSNSAAICPDGEFVVAMDEKTCRPICKGLPAGQEEMGTIVGCLAANGYCAFPSPASHAPPAGTRLYETHGGHAWDVTIGPRTFCALGFTAFQPTEEEGDGNGNFCRVMVQGIDPSTEKPIWHIHVGSNRTMEVACHAVCIQ